jgi:hypothetical protein
MTSEDFKFLFHAFMKRDAAYNVVVYCVAVVWIASAGNRLTEVEILDAVGSSNPGSSHTDSHTDSKVNLLRKNT